MPSESKSEDLFGAESPAARWVRRALTLLASAQFVLSYIAIRQYMRLPEYAAGRAALPFQYRVFPMLVMRVFARVPLLVRVGNHMPIDEPSVYALIDAGLAFCSLLVAIWATGRAVLRLTGDRSLARWFPLLLVPMCHANLANSWGLNYTAPYDVPAVAFFALGVWLIVTEQVGWLYPVFLFATLNRETSVFLLVFYAAWEWRRHAAGREPAEFSSPGRGARWRWVLHAGAMAALWLGVKVALAHIFPPDATRGDSVFDNHLLQNLKQICEPQQWPVLASVCAFALPVVGLGWRWIGNPPYALALAATLALWTAGMMIVGTIVEIRIFAEWAPLLVPALALIAQHWFGQWRSNHRVGSTWKTEDA